MKHGLDRGSVGWTENRLNCCAQRELGLFNWRGEGSERSTSTETWRGDWRKQARLCSVVPSDKARGSRRKQKYREFHLNIKTNTFTLKAVKHWSRLCRGCGVSLLLWMLDQTGLGAALSNLLQQTLLWGAEVGLHNPTGLFRPQLFRFWFGFYRLHIFIHKKKKVIQIFI